MSDEMDLIAFARMTEAEARAHLERVRWPDGPVCPHCGVVDEATLMKGKTTRPGLYNCRACRSPFSVTVGTIFEGSHIPLSKWLLGFYLFASSKKSLSALQLQRQLGLGSYRTAWHMAHRIRAAMANDPNPPKLAGIVEADETYVAGKPRKRRSHSQAMKHRKVKEYGVAVLVTRDGQARAKAMKTISKAEIVRFIDQNVDVPNSRLMTDEAPMYKNIGKVFGGGHATVRHKVREYARGTAHINTAESFNGLFKRAVNGAWHHISHEHINRYVQEQVFRWSHMKVTDAERTERALERVGGIRLYYRRPRASIPGFKQGLVAG